MSDVTVTNDPPAGNSPEARTPDGTLKDQSPTLPTQTEPPKKSEGGSFLTQEPDPPKPDAKEVVAEGDPKPESEPKKDDAPAGAPEKYEDFKLPDGYKMDEAAGKEITALFKDLGLSQEGAQKLVDVYAARLLKAEEAPFKAWADTQKDWVADINDRFGSKADATRIEINSAITNALPPSLARAFRTAMDITGAGSNPDIFEALSILAKPHLEGKPVPAGKVVDAANKPPGPVEKPSAAEAMYPHLIGNRARAT